MYQLQQAFFRKLLEKRGSLPLKPTGILRARGPNLENHFPLPWFPPSESGFNPKKSIYAMTQKPEMICTLTSRRLDDATR
jgi:hypothetical protein